MKKMKRVLAVVLALAMCMTAFVGCAKDDTGEKKTFTVGFDASFPPYGYADGEGGYTGFDIELATELAKRNGWEIKLQPIDWDAKDMELESKTIDCIWNGFTINGREDDYTWSEPYVDNSQVFVVRDEGEIKTVAEIKGMDIAVQADSSAEAALKEEENAYVADYNNIIPVPDYDTAILNLQSKAVDAVAMDIGVAQYQIESRDAKLVILSDKLSSEQYGIGFLKGNTELRDQVQATLDEMIEDGTFMEYAEKYGLQDAVIKK